MNAAEIVDKLAKTAPALRARGVAHLAIFGSRARGDARADSDLDVLLDVPEDRKFSLIDLVGVESVIGEAAGCPTGAVLRDGADPQFLARISGDVVEVF